MKIVSILINLWKEADGLYLIRILVEGESAILKKVIKISR